MGISAPPPSIPTASTTTTSPRPRPTSTAGNTTAPRERSPNEAFFLAGGRVDPDVRPCLRHNPGRRPSGYPALSLGLVAMEAFLRPRRERGRARGLVGKRKEEIRISLPRRELRRRFPG